MFYSNSWTKCLIYLIFITSGNSECPKPQVERNQYVVLTNDALLKNDFPEGSEVLFQCANGYMKAQGSESITCTNGEWSTLELICKKKDCGAPKEMPHLTYEFDKEGTLFGASARAICDKGYQVQGSSYRQCYATGWSGRSRCEGYTLIGNKSIECEEDGEYNSFLPECKDVNDLPLKPTTISASMTTLTVPPTIQGTHHSIGEHDTNTATNVNDIPLKPTSASITLTVPPTIQVSGRHHGIGEHDINAATRNAAAVGSVFVIVIVTLVLFVYYRFQKRKGSYQTGEDSRRKEELLQFQND
ncbi:sushi, von Willebrand factor type A, EGF and pentraxin domain-containing protein 1-like isoform X7 [Oncorhynchus masou masou]|uniref:sushi, von Willebrand factor type A, EGF and pentraxin domain-containing protein 1-like isoform X7 n=1 Tax=Oncorhynchus masou masou TaxID=90313 RepID=UPI003183C558